MEIFGVDVDSASLSWNLDLDIFSFPFTKHDIQVFFFVHFKVLLRIHLHI